MNFHVIRMGREQFEIAKSIISTIAVLMVNLLVYTNRTTKKLFHDDYVLKYITLCVGSFMLWNKNLFVAFLKNEWLFPVCRTTRHRTIFSRFSFCNKRGLTVFTYNCNGVLYWARDKVMPWMVNKFNVMFAAVTVTKMYAFTLLYRTQAQW